MHTGKLAQSITLLALTLTALLSLGLVYANFTPVLPSDNILIEADGRVIGTDKIVRNGDTYTFIGNVSGTEKVQGNIHSNMSCALAVYRSNIIIDGAGFTLQGNNLTGIEISNGVCRKPSEREVWNVTIKNLRITNCHIGVRCEFGGNHTFYGNYISNDYITQNVAGNFSGSSLGIAFWGSSGNNITHCTIGGSPAIYMHFAVSNNLVIENNIVFGANLAISGIETFDRNYWSDYSIRYPNASEVDSSGVWDVPYAFADITGFEDRIFQDEHPLMSPLAIPNFSSVLPEVIPAQESMVFPLSAIFAVASIAVFLGLLFYFIKRG